MARRHGLWTRMQDHFHTAPQGRLHEILFWAGSGVLVGILTWLGWLGGQVSTPFALLLVVLAVCLIGWSMLPQQPRLVAAPSKKKGRRK